MLYTHVVSEDGKQFAARLGELLTAPETSMVSAGNASFSDGSTRLRVNRNPALRLHVPKIQPERIWRTQFSGDYENSSTTRQQK